MVASVERIAMRFRDLPMDRDQLEQLGMGPTDEDTGGTPQAKANRQGQKSWKLDIHGECPNI